MESSTFLGKLYVFHHDEDHFTAAVPKNETIVFFLNFGGEFANNISLPIGKNVVDAHCREITTSYADTHGLEILEWLYPNNNPSISLGDLIPSLDIPEASPLGIRISENYGSWWAFRAVIRVAGQHAGKTIDLGESACLHCIDTPCVNACPAQAISIHNLPNMERCGHYRLSSNSSCFNTCHARLACPFGKDYHYPEHLINYLYENSLSGLQKWLNGKKA